jgi:hypothetical protein
MGRRARARDKAPRFQFDLKSPDNCMSAKQLEFYKGGR